MAQPNPIDNILKRTAEQHGVGEELVFDIASFQWSEVRQQAHKVKSIEITGLGHFEIKASACKRRLRKLNDYRIGYEKAIASMEEGSPKHGRYLKRMNTLMEEINFIQQRLNELTDAQVAGNSETTT